MKKATMFLMAGGLLCTLAFTSAQKIALTAENDCGYPDASGFVMTNTTSEGTTDKAIQIQLRDAAPTWDYTVKTHANNHGTFTTNRRGNGHMHLNLTDEDLLGGAMNIWDGGTRCWRAEYPIPTD